MSTGVGYKKSPPGVGGIEVFSLSGFFNDCDCQTFSVRGFFPRNFVCPVFIGVAHFHLFRDYLKGDLC